MQFQFFTKKETFNGFEAMQDIILNLFTLECFKPYLRYFQKYTAVIPKIEEQSLN